MTLFLCVGAKFSDKLKNDYASPLNVLIENERNIEAVKWAVENGAYLGEQPGGIPLLNAVSTQDKGIVELLLSLGADPNLYGDRV